LITFEFIKKNIDRLTKSVSQAARERSTRKIQEILLTIPNVGNFFAWQILCDLCECKLLGKCTDNQWTCLGPGAKSGLRRIFRMDSTRHELRNTRLLRDLCQFEGQSSGFKSLGIQFPAFLNKKLSLKNVEHGLCEFDKYFRYAVAVPNKARSYNEESSRTNLDKEASCTVCSKTMGNKGKIQCPTCYRVWHQNICKKNEKGGMLEGVWICSICFVNNETLEKQDFSHQEEDPGDEIGKVLQTCCH